MARTRTATLPTIVESRTRFLSTPRDLTDHDLDPTLPKHPWDERYDETGGLAECACCGARVKRVAIVTSTGGVEFDLGLDCYARHYDAKRIRSRIRESDKARAEWTGALDPKRGDAPALALRIASGDLVLDEAGRERWGRYIARWEAFAAQVEGDARLTDGDRADLFRAYRSTLVAWRALLG